MALAALIALTQLCIMWSLWIRRVTWTCRFEVAATLNIALQGAAVFLMSPCASETIGQLLHRITGQWNLEDYLGHDCYLVAATAVIYNTAGRLDEGSDLQRYFKQFVERPATLCIPILLATFTLGNGTKTYAPDFFTVHSDFWLATYWALLCGALIYLIGYSVRALLILREDPRSAKLANVYIAASVSGIIACMTRIITALAGWESATGYVWLFACVCGAGFALASGRSWLGKTRGFRRLAKLP